MHMLRIWLSCVLLLCAGGAGAAECPALLGHTFNPLIPDQPVSLCRYAGRVVLVVNTASNCGYTYQYDALEKIHRKYRDRGLVVIGFPANDFGAQEAGSNRQIAEFCKLNYGVSFAMSEKLSLPIARTPLYAGLIQATGRAPRWNFHKYLIDRAGKASSFDSAIEPDGREMSAAIEQALAAR